MVNKIDFSFYKGKKIFITGHTGFKGSWLSMILKEFGATIRGYSLTPNQEPSLFQLLELEENMQSVIADINDLEKLKEEIIDFQPDLIFHLAAQPLVIESYKYPIYTFQTNIIGTANVLESLRYVNKKCVTVCITTDKVYENKEWDYPYREEEAFGGYDPYSASKAGAEIVISSYLRSFFNKNNYESHQKSVVSARAGNVIGGGDWSADRIIPDIIRGLILEKEIQVRNPNSVRPWQHVIEPLIGYLSLGLQVFQNPMKFSPSYNFGPFTQDTFLVEKLVEQAIHLWGSGNWVDASNENAPHEAKLLKLDISKAGVELGWYPKLNAKESIGWTIDWYRNYYDNNNSAKEYTLTQIKRYLALCSF